MPDEYPLGTLDAFKQSSDFMQARKVDGQLHRRIIPTAGGAERHYRQKRQRSRGFYNRGDYSSGLDAFGSYDI